MRGQGGSESPQYADCAAPAPGRLAVLALAPRLRWLAVLGVSSWHWVPLTSGPHFFNSRSPLTTTGRPAPMPLGALWSLRSSPGSLPMTCSDRLGWRLRPVNRPPSRTCRRTSCPVGAGTRTACTPRERARRHTAGRSARPGHSACCSSGSRCPHCSRPPAAPRRHSRHRRSLHGRHDGHHRGGRQKASQRYPRSLLRWLFKAQTAPMGSQGITRSRDVQSCLNCPSRRRRRCWRWHCLPPRRCRR